MKLSFTEAGWSIGLERKIEAEALLAAQATPVGNRILSTTNSAVDRVTPGMRAVELLHFAELVLPSVDTPEEGSEVIEFPLKETQHLSGLLYGATHDARIKGVPTTEFDGELFRMESQVEEFFGME